jgi:FlaA1/EpsC-like NDP-sugar epimerase
MSIDEACYLVLEALLHTTNSQTFMLEMGDEILIEDIAKKLIELNNLKLNIDIKIEYIGLRPGEKMHEILQYDFESSEKTSVQKLIKLNSSRRVSSFNMKIFRNSLLKMIYNESVSNKDILSYINNNLKDFLK